jgi:hypothetical protein
VPVLLLQLDVTGGSYDNNVTAGWTDRTDLYLLQKPACHTAVCSGACRSNVEHLCYQRISYMGMCMPINHTRDAMVHTRMLCCRVHCKQLDNSKG